MSAVQSSDTSSTLGTVTATAVTPDVTLVGDARLEVVAATACH